MELDQAARSSQKPVYQGLKASPVPASKEVAFAVASEGIKVENADAPKSPSASLTGTGVYVAQDTKSGAAGVYNSLTKDGLWVGGTADTGSGFHVDNTGNAAVNGIVIGMQTFSSGAEAGKAGRYISGLENTEWNGTAVTGRAATEDQLKKVADTISGGTDYRLIANTAIGSEGKYTADENGNVDLTVQNGEDTANKKTVTIADVASKAQQDTNTSDINTNRTNIATNATNISNNATAIGKVDKFAVKYDAKADDTTEPNKGSITLGYTDGGKQQYTTIKNVADGMADNDAVNKGQLDKVQTEAGKHTTVMAGKNMTVTSTANDNGGTNYAVALNDTVTLGSGDNVVSLDGTTGKASIGGVVIGTQEVAYKTSGKKEIGTYVSGLGNTTWDSSDYVSGRAATEDQLQTVAGAERHVTGGSVNTSGVLNLTMNQGSNVTISGLDTYVKGVDSYVTEAKLEGNRLKITQNNQGKNYDIDLSGLTGSSSTDYRLIANKDKDGNEVAYTADADGNVGLTVQNGEDAANKKTVTIADVASKKQQDTNTSDINTNRTNIATNATNISNNATAIGNVDKFAVKYDSKVDATMEPDMNSITLKGDTYNVTTHQGGTTITNVADGADPSDAVNKSQLDKVQTEAGKHTTVGTTDTSTNLIVKKTDATADAGTHYEVNLNNKVTLGTAENKQVVLDGTIGKVTVGGGDHIVTLDGADGTASAVDFVMTGLAVIDPVTGPTGDKENRSFKKAGVIPGTVSEGTVSDSLALGNYSSITSPGAMISGSIAIGGAMIRGGTDKENANYNIAIGSGSGVERVNEAVVIGHGAKALKTNTNSDGSIVIGSKATLGPTGTSAPRSIEDTAIGNIVLGQSAYMTESMGSVAVGAGAYIRTDKDAMTNGSAVFGKRAGVSAAAADEANGKAGGNAMYSTALGAGATVTAAAGGNASYSTALGNGATVTANGDGNATGSMALGASANVTDAANSMALGAGSTVANADLTEVEKNAATGHGVISVGKSGADGFQRRIINVADGADDHDAVNVSQLNGVREAEDYVTSGSISAETGTLTLNRQKGGTVNIIGLDAYVLWDTSTDPLKSYIHNVKLLNGVVTATDFIMKEDTYAGITGDRNFKTAGIIPGTMSGGKMDGSLALGVGSSITSTNVDTQGSIAIGGATIMGGTQKDNENASFNIAIGVGAAVTAKNKIAAQYNTVIGSGAKAEQTSEAVVLGRNAQVLNPGQTNNGSIVIGNEATLKGTVGTATLALDPVGTIVMGQAAQVTNSTGSAVVGSSAQITTGTYAMTGESVVFGKSAKVTADTGTEKKQTDARFSVAVGANAWVTVEAGGQSQSSVAVGSGAKVTTDADAATGGSIAFGRDAAVWAKAADSAGSKAAGIANSGMALGDTSKVTANAGGNATGSVALGASAQVTDAKGSVALGAGSLVAANQNYVISVGSGIAATDQAPQYRRIINVANGVDAHDAVTVGQLNGGKSLSRSGETSNFLSAVGKIDWDAVTEKADLINQKVAEMTAEMAPSAKAVNFSLGSRVSPTVLAEEETKDGKPTPDTNPDGTSAPGNGFISRTDGTNTVKGDTTFQNAVTVEGQTTLKGGLDMAGNKITNVKDGEVSDTSKDAVNGSQLHSEQQARIEGDKILGDQINQFGRSINHLGSEIDSVGAISAALAGLHPIDYDPTESKYQLAAAMGSYDGSTALALGGFYNVNKNVLLSFGVSSALKGQKKTAGNIGATFRIGSGNANASAEDYTNRNLLNELVMVKQENAAQKESLASQDQKLAAVEQENTVQKQAIENQQKRLDELEAALMALQKNTH